MIRVEDIQFSPRLDRGSLVLGGEPHVVHCHYYNHFLQTSIEDAEGIYPVENVLVGTAQEIAHSQFHRLFQEKELREEGDRKALVETIYSLLGMGKVSLEEVCADGGQVSTPYEHYAYTYAATFPPRPKGKRGVAYFSQGYLAGAIEAIYDLPLGSMGSRQKACLTQGDSYVEWEFFRLSEPLPLQNSVGEGRYQTASLPQPEGTRVPFQSIRDAVLNLPLSPDPETGFIEAFDVVLTRLPGNYYALISERHFKNMLAAFGSDIAPVVLDMLIESGHVCAFNTLGGIMSSAEWDAVVRPYLDTPEDWLYGIISVMPAIGWGIVKPLTHPNPQSWKVSLHNWYESTAIASLPQERALTHSPFAEGIMNGILALVYKASIHTRRLTFDGELYSSLFRTGRLYESTFHQSRLRGDSVDVVEGYVVA
ncbi:MAG: hypothetical protein RMK19_04770 [Bacteroidia bacterium]|nr:hypothetical protein [Bacteroidia bacterium]MDW8015304.1 hypothetical protein [Bacteroidia bacterium]